MSEEKTYSEVLLESLEQQKKQTACLESVAESLIAVAGNLRKMANPPVYVSGTPVDIGLSKALFGDLEGLLFGGCCPKSQPQATTKEQTEIVLTQEQAANLREELYYMLSRAFDCGVWYNPEKHFMAEKKRKDLYHLAVESVGVVRKVLS